MTLRDALANLVAEHELRFGDDAHPATSRQCRYIAILVARGRMTAADVLDAVETWNGGYAWGLDRECASVIIQTWETPADAAERDRRRNARRAGAAASVPA